MIFPDTRMENNFFENSKAYSVLNYTLAIPGHFLVFPKNYFTEIIDMQNDIVSIFDTIDKTLKKITD